MYRIIAPISALLLLTITQLPRVHVAVAVVVFGCLMVSNVGRMIAAMSMITGSVEPRLRGGFLSANSSIQHIASGLGAQLGGWITSGAPEGQLQNFGHVGWIAMFCTLATLWLAGRVKILDAPTPPSAEQLSLPAAAEAVADAGEPIIVAASTK